MVRIVGLIVAFAAVSSALIWQASESLGGPPPPPVAPLATAAAPARRAPSPAAPWFAPDLVPAPAGPRDEVEAAAGEEGDEPPLTDGDESAAEAFATVRGQVFAQGGQALEAEVTLMRSPDDPTPVSVATMEDGSFEVVVDPGEWLLTARAAGFRPAKVEALALGANEAVEGLVVELEHGLAITGRVLDPDGNPLAARVVLTGEGYRLSTEATPEDGFRFDGLASGRFHVQVDEPWTGRDERTVFAGDDLTLYPRQRDYVTGVVFDGDGAPVAGAMVAAVPTEDDTAEDHDPGGFREPGSGACVGDGCRSEAQTDEAGRFELPVSRSARYTLVADAPQGRAQRSNVAANSRVALRLNAGEQLAVRVVDSATGLAAPRAQVCVLVDGMSHGCVSADEAGVARVTAFRDADVSVRPSAWNHQLESVGGVPERVSLEEAPRPRRGCLRVIRMEDVVVDSAPPPENVF